MQTSTSVKQAPLPGSDLFFRLSLQLVKESSNKLAFIAVDAVGDASVLDLMLLMAAARLAPQRNTHLIGRVVVGAFLYSTHGYAFPFCADVCTPFSSAFNSAAASLRMFFASTL